MMTRRTMIKSAAGVGAALAAGNLALAQDSSPGEKVVKNGRINQSVCEWCFKMWKDKDLFCGNVQNLGMHGIDLVGPDWFPTLKKYGLVGTMTTTHSIPKGLNRKENWDESLGKIRVAIDATSEAGFPNVICFSCNRAGMDDEEGLKNCAEPLKQVVGQAAVKKV